LVQYQLTNIPNVSQLLGSIHLRVHLMHLLPSMAPMYLVTVKSKLNKPNQRDQREKDQRDNQGNAITAQAQNILLSLAQIDLSKRLKNASTVTAPNTWLDSALIDQKKKRKLVPEEVEVVEDPEDLEEEES